MNDDTRDYSAIMQLQRSYADVSTRRAWDEVPLLATPDAHFSFDTRSGEVFEIQGPVAFGEFGAKMTESFTFYEYIPLNFVVTIGSDGTAEGRSYSLEVAEDGETGDWNEFYGVYRDEYRLFEGTWRFSRRHYRTFGRRTGGRLEAFALEDRPL
ncbi:MAG: nuclear transport factor 2 family protein [Acidimicrobiales bacterium]